MLGLLVIVPDWLTSEKSLTVATWGLVSVTFLLVLATLILYLDSRAKGKEQVQRWKREDEFRSREAKPVAVVELGKRRTSPHVVALCYNLGSHPFILDKLIVSTENGMTRISDLLGPYVVLPGTHVPVIIDCIELLKRKSQLQDARILFEIKGATGSLTTAPVPFSIYPDPSEGYGWTVGGPESRLEGMLVQQPRFIPDEDN